MRRRELDILYVATRAALLLWVPLFLSDLTLYLNYAREVIPGGKWPYAGFDFEYPPLAFVLMALPAWLHDKLGMNDTESYRMLFGLCLLPFDFLMYRRFRKFPPFPGAAFAYVLFTCALGLLLFDRFDILVGFLIAWPFLGASPAGDLKYGVSWGLGGALKLVPMLAAPARVLEWPGTLKERAIRLVKFGSLVAVPFAVCCAVVAAVAHGKISFLSYHSDRGVQIESLPGSVIMFLQSYTNLVSSKVEWNFGSQNLAPIPGLVVTSRILFVWSLLFTYAVIFFRRRDALSATWLIISGFITFGYVLSPQFLLWLVPIGICAAGTVKHPGKRTAWVALFAAVVILTGAHFRYYWDYVNLHRFAVAMVLARNLLLVALWGLSWAWMGHKPSKTLDNPTPVPV